MIGKWPHVEFGQVLQFRKPDIAVQPLDTYDFAGVYSFGRGVFRGQQRMGNAFSYRVLTRLRENDFVYPKLMAWEGAFGVVPQQCANCFVSPEFPVFEVDQHRLLPKFLGYYFQLPKTWAAVSGSSVGTNVRRRRLHPRIFLTRLFALPPVEEQARIVAKLDELTVRVAEAASLKAKTSLASARSWKLLSHMARETAWPVRSLNDMVDFVDDRRIPLSAAERRSRRGPYPYYGASGVIDHIDDFIFDEPLVLLSEDGANLINRSSPIAFIATGKYWVNNHAHVLRPRLDVVDIHFLSYALCDYDVSVFNFASAQAKLNQRNAAQIRFPLPPLSEQRKIVARLDAARIRLDALTTLQTDTSSALDALLPSILDRAFKGEL